MRSLPLIEVCRALDRARSHYEIGLSGSLFDSKKADKIVAEIVDAAERFSKLVTPSNGGRYPTLAEKVTVLVDALERVANRVGAALLPLDTALVHVAQECTAPTDAQFWSKQQPQQLLGLVLHEPSLVMELQTRGILVWGDDQDSKIRLVNTNWLTTHAAIFAFVTGDNPAGNRCRFCRLPERKSNSLVTVDTPARNLHYPALTIKAESQVHADCKQPWLDWVQIARRYRNADEAMQADESEGRNGAPVPALPSIADEPVRDVSGCTRG